MSMEGRTTENLQHHILHPEHKVAKSEEELVRKYNQVEKWCNQQIAEGNAFMFDPNLFRQTFRSTSKDLDFPLQSLESFFRSLHMKHIKSTSYKVQNCFLSKYLPMYQRGNKSIQQMALEANFSPYLMARLVVDHVTNFSGKGKKRLISAMRDPIGQLGTIDCIQEAFWETENEWKQRQEGRQEQYVFLKKLKSPLISLCAICECYVLTRRALTSPPD
jgi:hypothetical protein